MSPFLISEKSLNISYFSLFPFLIYPLIYLTNKTQNIEIKIYDIKNIQLKRFIYIYQFIMGY